jgi:REP element-mobilizing transposase RayT
MRSSGQTKLFDEKYSLQYGGSLRKKAANRGARPLSSISTLHVVLRSSQAKGLWSFRNPKHLDKIMSFIRQFSQIKGVQLLSFANVGNHFHFHVKIPNRTLYQAWIRGLTSGLAMMVLGRKGFKALKEKNLRFWDYRPFTRVVRSFKGFLKLKDYIEINQLEGLGIARQRAVFMAYRSAQNQWKAWKNRQDPNQKSFNLKT